MWDEHSVNVQRSDVSTDDESPAPPRTPSPYSGALSDHLLAPRQTDAKSAFVLLLTFMATIGGFLFGYDTGIVSGAVILLKLCVVQEEFALNYVWQEAFVSVTLAAAAVLSLFAGIINDRFGRKPTILVSSVVFAAGAVLLGAARQRWELIAGRAILGVAIGMSSGTIPMYIAESAPSHLRGQLVTLNNMFVTGGQMVAAVIAGIFSNKQNGWRYMFGLAALPAIVQLLGFVFMPETPRWFVTKGRLEDARHSLQRIRGRDANVDQELHEIQQNSQESESESGSTLLRMLLTPHVRWALFIGVMLQAFQQITGINTVMYYSATIIQMSGVHSASMAIWLAALVASVNLLFSFVGLYLVDRLGRRPLILLSIGGTMLSLMVLAVGFQLASSSSPDVTAWERSNTTALDQCANYTLCDRCATNHGCGFCYLAELNGDPGNGSCVAVAKDPSGNVVSARSAYGRCSAGGAGGAPEPPLYWAYEYCPNPFAWMAVFGLVLYLMCFAPGMGPMPWTINSEIYPLWARSTGNSISTCVNWSSNLLVSITFLSLTEAITRQGAFWLYSGMAALGLVFIWLFLPETKGKQLEEVQSLFRGPHVIPCVSKLSSSSSYEPLDSILQDDR